MQNPLLSRTPATVVALSLVTLLGLSACGGSQHASPASGSVAGGTTMNRAADAAAPKAQSMRANSGNLGNTGAGYAAPRPAALVSGPKLIKTGSVALQSAQIGHVLVRVYGLVGGVGGDVSREDTSTGAHGRVVRSMMVLQVPVASFDPTLNDLSRLGTLVDRVRTAKDVTTAVADVHSRVRSAHQSIRTLRRLFGRATKLGDIIRLEDELSQREADLESLLAQQRALHDKTAMSTITLTVELPPVTVKPPASTHHAAGGFVSGIREGWHALTRTGLAVGHGLGVVLPLGTVALLLAGIALVVVRRFVPRPAPPVKTSVEP